jgi:ABC-type uncharacterized transport system permease subunit
MHEMSVIWLRVAAVLYAVGLIHAILTILKRRAKLFRLAFITFCGGLSLHFVSIVEEAAYTGHFPANNFYESISLCAYLIGLLYLLVYLRSHIETLSAFLFPLIFLMTLVGALGSPVSSWSDPKVRDAWLLVHVALVLTGYAAMLLMAAGSVAYLIQERQLKSKRGSVFLNRLPPLGVLDSLISTSMGAGFVLITLAVIAGSTWAFVESGTRWIAQPKIVVSMVTWVFYLLLVFLRVSAGWRGRKAAVMSIVVLGCSALTWAAHVGLRPMFTR